MDEMLAVFGGAALAVVGVKLFDRYERDMTKAATKSWKVIRDTVTPAKVKSTKKARKARK